MPEAKATGKRVDPWETPKETWEYFSIPTETPLGEPHDNFSINHRTFKAGQTYLVPKEVADYLKERLRVYTKESVRRLQPNRDVTAEHAVNFGSANPAQAIDASKLN